MEETDAALWARAVNGEPECFGVIFERHARRIHAHCFRRTANAAMAEDLTSVVFLEAWRRREEIVLASDSALPWLFGVATNVCRNATRALHRYHDAVARIPQPPQSDHVGDEVAERIDSERRMQAVSRSLDVLSPNDKDVITLCVWQRLSYEEASVALGIPVGTVQSRLSRARARLKQAAIQREQRPSNEHITGEHRTMPRRSEDS